MFGGGHLKCSYARQKEKKVEEGFHFKSLAKFRHIGNKTDMMVGETNLGIVMKAL